MIDAILFDAGETLLNLDLGAIVEACGPPVDEAAVTLALSRARRDLDQFFLPLLAAKTYLPQQAYADGRGMRVADLLLDHLGLDPRRKLAAGERLMALDRALRLWTVVPDDARPTLAALRARGVKLGVVSNSDGHIEWKLNDVGLGGLFDAVLDSHLEGVSKPDPAIFRRAVERLGVEASRTLYVGDLYAIDVVACAHAGLQGALIDRSGGLYETPACTRIASLSGLLGLIEISTSLRGEISISSRAESSRRADIIDR
jgi:putative hydrolase of the HAD superfamily